MKEFARPVINSNCDNFLSPKNRKSQAHISRIQPDKFTFLKSNLLVQNILNSNPRPSYDHMPPKSNKDKNNCTPNNESFLGKSDRKGQTWSQNTIKENDAYINCEIQKVKLVQQSQVYREKNQRVKTLVKYRSQKTFQQFKQQQKQLNQKIQNIAVMKRQISDKAGQIMGKRQDTSYLGRNLIKQGQNFLKQLRQTNPGLKKAKIQATRLLMKENVKKNRRHQGKEQSQDALNNSNPQQMSVATSMLETSYIDYAQTKDLKQKQHSDVVIAKLIKNKSYDNVFLQQKRRAAWQGFSQHWKKGGQKQQVQRQLKNKKNKKKVIKSRFESTDHEILNYSDNFTRHLALKKYQNTFLETACTFKIIEQA